MSEYETMLNIKSLIAATVLSGLAVASFAQAPVATVKPAPAPAVATAAAPAAMSTDTTTTAKPTAKKVKHSRTNKAVAKTAAKPADAATK
jgi:hypothetical protein